MPVSDAENRLSLMYVSGILPHAKALFDVYFVPRCHIFKTHKRHKGKNYIKPCKGHCVLRAAEGGAYHKAG